MSHLWSVYICLALGLWCAFEGGVFKAFSEFIMKGLQRAAPASAIEAMQQINKTVIRTEFVAALFAITAFSLAFALYGLIALDGVVRLILIAAALLYLCGVFLMTLFGNVPMNNRLAALDHRSADAQAYWEVYGKKWTRLNHFRTGGSFLAAGLYLVAALSLMVGKSV
ncbi:MAG: anthrone oxygenase family protein [Parasphingorhabdus sp.]|uniref:anthrone oxygenase family protein n=1 Tax=Parasphingorhabdus sp. TaxID=2709688 RepID=UPI0032986225